MCDINNAGLQVLEFRRFTQVIWAFLSAHPYWILLAGPLRLTYRALPDFDKLDPTRAASKYFSHFRGWLMGSTTLRGEPQPEDAVSYYKLHSKTYHDHSVHCRGIVTLHWA
jgi:hypothetical protein